MASITLKNIPEPIHSAYKRKAEVNLRSMQAEILLALAQGIDATDAAFCLNVDDVAGMLKPQRKGITVREMDDAINQSMRESWK